MNTTPSGSKGFSPVRAQVVAPLRSLRGQAARLAHRSDPVLLVAFVWLAVYLYLTVIAKPQTDGHSVVSSVWSIPAGIGIGVMSLRLARDRTLTARDLLPWRLVAIAGFAMPFGGAIWIASDGRTASPLAIAEGVGTFGPLCLLWAATLLWRRKDDVRAAARHEVLLDLTTLVLVAGILLWYVVLDQLPPGSASEIVARGAFAMIGLAAIVVASRIALLPTTGIGQLAATVLVLGVGAGVVGTLAIGFGSGGTGAVAIGQISLGLLYLAALVCARLETQARAQPQSQPREHGPSPLLYASVAIGSIPLLASVLDLSAHHIAVVIWLAGMSAAVVIRQFFTAREALTSEAARRKTEARFGWLVRNSSDLIMAVDARGMIDYLSPSVERLLGSPGAQLLGTNITDLAHPDDVAEIGSLVERAMASPGLKVSGEWQLRQANGSWLPVETVASSGTGDFNTTGVVLNTRDLQERKALEQKLTFQAFHDPLTRLANRSLFRERVEHALDRRNPSDIAVLFIDLDNFKTINDSLGHSAGDHVLVETAHRIRSTLRTEDTAARFGGDEFAVLLEEADVTTAARVAERIRAALGTPFWVLGQEVFISASIGIAIQQQGEVAGDLLRNADVAMYTAKTKGKSRFEIFEPAMHDAVVARLGLEAELRRALDREEFVVHYQPIVKLQTGEVIGAEALVRWQHPTRGLIPPLEFIPLAEETGLIVPLGAWILGQACHQLAEWQRARGGGEPFVMNVNLSSRQLIRDVIADEVAAAVDESGIRASWLVLEVTETVLMADPVTAEAALGHIRDLGVRVALDDFGSGYSSLSHLRRFPIDIVKIDKSFVDDVAVEGVKSAIARGIIELGRAMHIQTVAEGIEADDQAETLRDLGCELGQGFFFAQPLAPAAWEDLLHTDGDAANGDRRTWIPGMVEATATGGAMVSGGTVGSGGAMNGGETLVCGVVLGSGEALGSGAADRSATGGASSTGGGSPSFGSAVAPAGAKRRASRSRKAA